MDRTDRPRLRAVRPSVPSDSYISVSTTVTSVKQDGEVIDLVAVERLLNGEKVYGTTLAERLTALGILVRRGRTLRGAANQVGIRPSQALKLRPSLAAYDTRGPGVSA
ncbi:hypothetical protein AB0O03_28760 [Streptomyces diastaticus]|uniref:hypothetical protein n=1 Tax=Streptomyces diastaticus TaxID=1956 RepID=UPI00341AC2CE